MCPKASVVRPEAAVRPSAAVVRPGRPYRPAAVHKRLRILGSVPLRFLYSRRGDSKPRGLAYIIIIIYYSWNGGRAEAVCAGGKGVRMR